MTDHTRRPGRWISHWEPDDPHFWQTTGRRVATRNLLLSIFAENLGFSVWVLMSIVVAFLDDAGFSFSLTQIFWLLIVPNLVGAALRVPYTFAVSRFGGRAFTAFSAGVLLIPTGMLAVAVTDTGTPYWFFLLTAAAMGLGGGNFSSSMANISFFFPEGRKGVALGINAAAGNLGVASTQLIVVLVIHLGTGLNLAYAALMWMPLLCVAAVAAWARMDSLTSATPDGVSYRRAMRNRQTWVMSFLYVGTFGSFIGFSFAFPALIQYQFGGQVAVAFLGPLIGSLSRPAGGWFADRIGGARVTLWTFAGLAVGVGGVLTSLRLNAFWLFFASFVGLFVLSGVGNGATYRMIPLIFSAQARASALADGTDPAPLLTTARRQAAAAVGVVGAVGAAGGVLINLAFTLSREATGTLDAAFTAFLAIYVACAVVTWWYYLRTGFAVRRSPSLAHADV
ncbi:nitrate/nitrite transporter [Spongiactinospora sp. TRM90649]|uniref:MFS transporter n=1 Tax=Spongiactinospora sp. TRM90649 TaxID=3031114 RepID=UPI0023F6B2DF|nr:nitrate/nitrite transporter [Spongiactinospora sp. TRM90649]MDF5753548.1 NarK/NasA family nitrate transporter [Spongiactinospora sp. TRM90649]